jgi:hypothetical protein
LRDLEQFRNDLAEHLRGIFDQEIEEELARLVGEGMSDHTMRAYRSEWTKFQTWCVEQKLPSLRTCPEVVAFYVVTLTAGGAKTKDTERAVSAIKWMHRVRDNAGHAALSAGHTGDLDGVLVKAALRWARKVETEKKTSPEDQPTQPKKGNGHVGV